MALVDLLGDKLMKDKGKGETETSSLSKDGKYVGLYFSAHWCPPCRGFTPKLAEFYNKFKKNDAADTMEMVFVSSDKEEESFNDYYAEMPWLALPYSDRDKKNALSKKFKVQGIPTLIVLDSQTGEVVCKDGRSAVMNDPEGKEFPWKPKPLLDVLPGNFIDNKKNTFTMDDLKDKYLGIYFSAHWCPPCKNFTPKLVAGYEKWKADGKKFEVIFASRDRTEDSFNKYFESMPWLALPFEDSRVGELAKIFEVSGIPMLIILDPCRNVITSEGRGAVMKDPEGKAFPWYPPPCYELDSFSSGIINEEPCLILFADIEEDDDVQKAMNLMKPVAEKIIQAEKDKCKEAVCKFMVAGDDDMVESLQQFLGIADESLPLLILLDIPEQRVSLCEEKEINTEVIQGYYDKFAGDKLTWKALGQ